MFFEVEAADDQAATDMAHRMRVLAGLRVCREAGNERPWLVLIVRAQADAIEEGSPRMLVELSVNPQVIPWCARVDLRLLWGQAHELPARIDVEPGVWIART